MTLNLFSQNKFVGGKFCEQGASPYTSFSVFDSLGNCFFIGFPNGNRIYTDPKHNKDTFNIKDNESEFITYYGNWKYSAKSIQVTVKSHDSIPLVQMSSTSYQNLSGIKNFTATDVYGKKIMRFRFFRLYSDSIFVPIYSDSSTGILRLDKFNIDKVYIPGLDAWIITDTLPSECNLDFAIPSSLVIYLSPINKHYEGYRNKIIESVFKWEKPTLYPHGKYWLYLCDF